MSELALRHSSLPVMSSQSCRESEGGASCVLTVVCGIVSASHSREIVSVHCLTYFATLHTLNPNRDKLLQELSSDSKASDFFVSVLCVAELRNGVSSDNYCYRGAHFA